MAEDMGRGPFVGTRILDLADEKGAYCGKMFADMGAEVIKIEPPGGDSTRNLPPFVDDIPDPDGSLYFLYNNTSKRSITLDIDKVEGQQLFKRLAATADVVLESFPVGYLARLGLGYEALSKDNPRLIMTSVTPFGQTGPHRHFKGPDIVPFAMSGLMNVIGEREGTPVVAGGKQANFLGSLNAADATALALFMRAATGKGQHIDISLQECVTAITSNSGVCNLLYDGILRSRSVTVPGAMPQGNFPTKNGYLNMLIARPWHWDAMAKWVSEVTGNKDILDEKYKGPAINRIPYEKEINKWTMEFTSRFTKEELFLQGPKRGLPLGPVYTTADLLQDPHLKQRQFCEKVSSSERRELTYPGAPYRFTDSPWGIRKPAPKLGEDNQAIYERELKLSKEDLGVLRAAGVI